MVRDCFGLYEELVEGRVLEVGIVRCHSQFNKAGNVQTADLSGVIDQGDPSDLHIVLRGDDNLGFAGNGVVGTPEYRPVEGKVDRIAIGTAADRMIGRRPQTIGIQLMDIATCSLGIAGRIGPPACKLSVAHWL